MDVRTCASIAAICFNVCEHLYWAKAEVKYIWSAPTHFASLMFMFCQKIGPFGRIALRYSDIIIEKDPYNGFIWFAFKYVASHIMLLLVDLVLLYRIYIWYNRRFIIRLVVYLIPICRISMAMTVLNVNFNKLTKPNAAPSKGIGVFYSMIFLGGGEFIMQGIIVAFTGFKHYLFHYAGVGRTPIGYRLTREGIRTPILTILLLILTMAVSVYNVNAAQAAFAFYTTSMGVLGCRLLLSTRKYFGDDRDNISDTTLKTSSRARWSSSETSDSD